MNPKVSAVIPAYNEEKYIGKCLESLKKQTFKDFEIIVVDNNCTDKTAEIARAYGARVVKESKQGMIPARDRGFDEAKTDIIARTDADSIPTPTWLETIYKTFSDNPDVVAMTGPILPPSHNLFDWTISVYSSFISIVLGYVFSGYIYLIGQNMGIRKSAWKKIKACTDDTKVPEDVDLSIHLSHVGKIARVRSLKVVGSLRKLYNNPFFALKLYLGIYLFRYINMLYIHRKK